MKIGAVVVTYNRYRDLVRALKTFEEQTSLPQYVIVVDNHSSDETYDYLEEWKKRNTGFKRIVIHMEENIGGSGGFYMGLKKSLELDADWVWVSDDDAFLETDALAQAEQYLDVHEKEALNISAICGVVINEGKIDLSHRKRYFTKGVKVIGECVPLEEYDKLSFELNAFSYVGTIISKKKMQQVGVTRQDYFIWWDDTEHSLRLSKVGKIVCIPAIKVHHNIPDQPFSLTWKNYYNFRNMSETYRQHMPKRCYCYLYMRNRFKVWLGKVFGWKREEMKILNAACQDVKNGKFGLHSVYRPGWKKDN